MQRLAIASITAATCSIAYGATLIPVGSDTPEGQFLKYFIVIVLSILGWAASSLPVIADWQTGDFKKRTVIIQGLVKAIFAGYLMFFSAVGFGQNIMACYVAAATAAYAGDKYLSRGKPSPQNETDELAK